jgi:hypothetical protein
VSGNGFTASARWLRRAALAALLPALLGGCVTSTVDEMVFNEPVAGIGDASVVILGRRHASDYETEFDFIECIADHIGAATRASRSSTRSSSSTACTRGSSHARRRCGRRTSTGSCTATGRGAARGPEARVHDLGGRQYGADQFRRLHDLRGWPRRRRLFRLRHLGQCLGLRGTIWDFTDRAEVGRLNASTSGQSYMPAVVVPIPIIAPVQGTACDGLGEQLLQFLSSEH